ncbi:MAG: SDR family oxidoreductase [candidate division Zixibacteria bacterium]|nr:SDR family oxidoreductase [candidate division Zixibacteria bacterium]
MPLKGRVALITGASGGIGSAVARRCAEQGMHIAAHYHQNADKAALLADDIRKTGVEALPVPADLTDPEAVAVMIDTVQHHLGSIDLLVNNAMLSHEFDALTQPCFEQVAWEDYRRQFEGAAKTAYLCCQTVLPDMKKRRSGSIVCILTNLIFTPEVAYHAYTTAKASLIGFSRTLAAEAGPWGITVNMIAPGLIAGTGMSGHHTPDTLEQVAHRTPMRRVGRPEDVADAVLFFASSTFVTGVCLVVDGGLTMH